MAFIKVRGLSGDVKVVPRSMYDSYLKHIGYIEIVSKNKKKDEIWDQDDGNGSEVIEEIDNIESIPISDMNSKQVKEYAKMKGIDVSGAKSTKEAKDIIRHWMQEVGA